MSIFYLIYQRSPFLEALVESGATGNAGTLTVGSEQSPTEKINLSNGARILVNTLGEGDAGILSIFADNLQIDGGVDGLLTGLFASVESGATGKGGSIFIGSEQFSTQQLTLKNGAQLVANTFSQGNAGDLSIFANNLNIDGIGNFPSGLFAEVGQNATGDLDELALTAWIAKYTVENSSN